MYVYLCVYVCVYLFYLTVHVQNSLFIPVKFAIIHNAKPAKQMSVNRSPFSFLLLNTTILNTILTQMSPHSNAPLLKPTSTKPSGANRRGKKPQWASLARSGLFLEHPLIHLPLPLPHNRSSPRRDSFRKATLSPRWLPLISVINDVPPPLSEWLKNIFNLSHLCRVGRMWGTDLGYSLPPWRTGSEALFALAITINILKWGNRWWRGGGCVVVSGGV